MKAFIFDMDGVLIDSEPLHTRTKLSALRHYGVSFAAERLSSYVGRSTRELFCEAVTEQGLSGIDIGEMVDYKHKLYLDILRDDHDLQPIEGSKELIESLRAAALPLALASSAGRKVIESVLERFFLTDYFSAVLSGAELPRSKPDPAVYLLAAQRLKVLPEDCVVLEDSASGVAAAKSAGMYCIAYHNPHSGKQDLGKADRIVEHIAEIDIEAL